MSFSERLPIIICSIGAVLPTTNTYAAVGNESVISNTVNTLAAVKVTSYTAAKTKAKPAPSLQPLTCIDTPRSGTFLTKSTLIGGWALNKSGVKEVQILVDGKLKGRAKIGNSRPDVAKVYPAYGSKNSGYNYTLDYKSIGQGSHTITVKAIGKNNTSKTSSVKINVNKLVSMVDIDTPSSGFNVNKNFNVNGWVLNGSGVKQVQVYVDNRLIGNASIGRFRPDVAKVFPNYNNRNSGYSLTILKNKISAGNHTITVKSRGNDGVVTSKSVKISKPKDLLCIDSPQQGQHVKNSITVSGWALSIENMRQVKISIDNKFVGNATIGLSRADVAKAYPVYLKGNSGFRYNLNVSKLSKGNHTITVTAIDVSGNSVSSSKTISTAEVKSVVTLSNKVSTTKGQAIISYAEKFKGVKYVWGGESPSGFDCSGFTEYVYNHFSVKLPHNAAEQYGYGKSVSKSSLQPGDLVFFGKTASSIYHVGIYIGNGNFINAPKPGDKVKITALRYMPDYYGAKRITIK
ncbi:NlpC/P60 family protein [Clostridium sp.]|uniref:NlpC/P60 family protein n=1 Tax=Clostridium sp. TaxID=1506 RepID=UPI002584E89D|nr:NlpC/P60 family protein [Clostridium sp.]MDF2505827.1 NlpC/P60 family protein [Clostridium sp.]